MPNVQQLYARDCDAQYHRDGVQDAMTALKKFHAGRGEAADSMVWRINAAVTATPVVAIGTTTCNLYAMIIRSPAGATNTVFVKVSNSTGGTNTTAVMDCIGCTAANTRTVVYFPGQDGKALFTNGIDLWCTTTAAGTTAPAAADRPDVYVLIDT